MHNENVRRLPQVELFACTAMFLAARAIPCILLGQNFSLLELVQTLLQRDALGTASLALFPLQLHVWIAQTLKVVERGTSTQIVVTVICIAEDTVPGIAVPFDNDTLSETNKGAGHIVRG